MREHPVAPFTRPFNASRAGRVVRIDNRRLARVAKLAGAPRDPSAGLVLQARVGARIELGQPLFTVHAEAIGELDYALAYARAAGEIIMLEENA
jgi:thymidine phosphorylase